MRKQKWVAIFLSLTLMSLPGLTACNFTAKPEGGFTPTVEAIITPTATTVTVEVPPTLTPTQPVISTQVVQIASPVPTETPAPPTESPTPTETPGPYIHIIKEGETLGAIIQFYDYRDFAVIDEIVRLNNLASADFLPGAGSELIIPRQTATLTPEGVELTATADATRNTTTQGGVVIPGTTQITCHTVEEGETVVGIAEQYNTTLEVLSQLNPNLYWFGCNFSNYSGGPDCNPNIQVSQCINVPAPTPTPTLSPTPSGNETATPTPTYVPPISVYPPEGAVAPAGVFTLHWVSVGVLAENEHYLVKVIDTVNNETYLQVTKDTSMQLPASMIPEDGQAHIITWEVQVATQNENGDYRPITDSDRHSFQWQSR
jgi:hypothetical protein